MTAAGRPLLLTYRALGLGDLLTSVPALRALRRAFPDHHHVLATSGWLAPLVATIDAVDGHLPVGALEPLPPDTAGADVAVDLHGRGPASHEVLLAAGPRRLIAFAHPDVPASAGGPVHLDDEHEVARWCLLLTASGVPADPSDLDLRPPVGPPPVDVAGATLVHPGAKAPARRWPHERFAEVAATERRRGRRVVVTGSADERSLAERVARAAGLRDEAVLAGELGLADLARTVAAAGRVVCGDTGVAHLATAYGTPSVVLFGPVPPSAWGPPVDRHGRHRPLWAGQRGDPLGERVDPGLLRLQPADVLRELAVLDEPHRTAAASRRQAGSGVR